MDDNKKNVNYEELWDSEIDDIWDIFFPYANEKKESLKKLDISDQKKPRRYLRFLTM